MSDSTYRLETLTRTHDREGFTCGDDALDAYLLRTALQNQKRDVSRCYVLAADRKIAGFYTLAAAEVPLADLGERVTRLPRYPSVPCVRVGRMAVATYAHGRGLGRLLIADAARRTRQSGLGAVGMLIDPKPDAVGFYRALGFEPLGEGGPMFASLRSLTEGTP